MIDFTGVKAVEIPEGVVKKIMRGVDVLWEKVGGYTNLAEPLPDNTTDTTKWVNGYRISSSGLTTSGAAGYTVSNWVDVTFGDIIEVTGVILHSGGHRTMIELATTSGSTINVYAYFNLPLTNGAIDYLTYLGEENGVYRWAVTTETYGHAPKRFRFAMPTPANAADVIITVNEPIT